MLCIFLSGVCFSLAVLYRGNYLLWFYILVIMFIIKLIRLKIIGIFHKNYLCILFFVIGIILPTIPQIYISYIHDGIFSLYAYDKVGVYRSPTQTLIEEGTASGVVQEVEQDIVERTFMLGDMDIKSIMTRRKDTVNLKAVL